MKHILTNTSAKLSIFLASSLLALFGCATYNEVESEAVTSSLDFGETNRFTVDVQDTSMIDTAFSDNLRDMATEVLINELEREGFDYVGQRNPDLQMSFGTYVVTDSGYVDTSLPLSRRVVDEDVTSGPRNRGTDTIITMRSPEPIYLSGPSRIFILDVTDSETKVLLWRAYTIDRSTGLDPNTLTESIQQLVERLDAET